MLDDQETEYVAAGAKAAEDRAVAPGTAPQRCDLDWTLPMNLYHVLNYHVSVLVLFVYLLIPSAAAATLVCCWSPWTEKADVVHGRSCQGLVLENMGKNLAAGVVPRCRGLQEQRRLAEVSHNPAPTSTPTSRPSTPRLCPSVTLPSFHPGVLFHLFCFRLQPSQPPASITPTG